MVICSRWQSPTLSRDANPSSSFSISLFRSFRRSSIGTRHTPYLLSCDCNSLLQTKDFRDWISEIEQVNNLQFNYLDIFTITMRVNYCGQMLHVSDEAEWRWTQLYGHWYTFFRDLEVVEPSMEVKSTRFNPELQMSIPWLHFLK